MSVPSPHHVVHLVGFVAASVSSDRKMSQRPTAAQPRAQLGCPPVSRAPWSAAPPQNPFCANFHPLHQPVAPIIHPCDIPLHSNAGSHSDHPARIRIQQSCSAWYCRIWVKCALACNADWNISVPSHPASIRESAPLPIASRTALMFCIVCSSPPSFFAGLFVFRNAPPLRNRAHQPRFCRRLG